MMNELYLNGPPAVSAVLRHAAVALERTAGVVDAWHDRVQRLHRAASAARVDGIVPVSRWACNPSDHGVEDAVLTAVLAFFASATVALLTLP